MFFWSAKKKIKKRNDLFKKRKTSTSRQTLFTFFLKVFCRINTLTLLVNHRNLILNHKIIKQCIQWMINVYLALSHSGVIELELNWFSWEEEWENWAAKKKKKKKII